VPRSTQEAMAIGRAVITTDVPGCRETVVDGLNGFLIPPFDSNALVEAMKKFIENPYLVEKMGEESYLIAKDKFDAKKVNKKLINILEI
jgi:glycosyltransferase involved in cell wall biosynthesis